MKKVLTQFDCKKVLVAPSLLAADFNNLESDVKRIEQAGADLLHLDVMDGHFVPNLSFGAPVISALRKVSTLPFDTHLMLSNPLKYVKQFSDIGSDHITFHVESDDDPAGVIAALRDLGVSVGISIKPKTPVSAIEQYIDKVDLVLVMSVEPGFGGQSFMPEVVCKLPEIRAIADKVNPSLHIEIDGGIGGETAKIVVPKGANMLVAGTSVFRSADGADATIKRLHDTREMLCTECAK